MQTFTCSSPTKNTERNQFLKCGSEGHFRPTPPPPSVSLAEDLARSVTVLGCHWDDGGEETVSGVLIILKNKESAPARLEESSLLAPTFAICMLFKVENINHGNRKPKP